MSEPRLLKIPERCRSVAEALATASKLDLPNIVILSETDTGMILLSAGSGDPLLAAQVLWILESGKNLLLLPQMYEREQ